MYDRFFLAARQDDRRDDRPVEFTAEELASVASDLGLSGKPPRRTGLHRFLGGIAVGIAVGGSALYLTRAAPPDDAFAARGAPLAVATRPVSFHAYCATDDDPPRFVGEVQPGAPLACATSGALIVTARVKDSLEPDARAHLVLRDAQTPDGAPAARGPDARLPAPGDFTPINASLELSQVPPGRYTAVVVWGSEGRQEHALGPLDVISPPTEK